MCLYCTQDLSFEEATTKKSAAPGNSRPKFAEDFRVVLKEIREIQAFTPLSSRSHPTFKWNLHSLPHKELCKSINQTFYALRTIH